MSDHIQINAKQAPELLTDVLKAGLVPMITSSPGLGKSSIAKQIAHNANLQVIDVRLSQCDPTDLNGFPKIDGEKATYVPMDTFPVEGDPLPENKKGWLLLMDELNSAPMSVQAAAYKIILDKEVGQHKLHPSVAVMAAGNLASDRAIVNRLSTAMQSRMVHFEMAIDHEAWIEWANGAGIDYRIISYINFKPESLQKFNPDHQDHTFACPRTWEFLSKIIKPWNDIHHSKTAVLAGTISEGVAREFMGFCKIFTKLPTIQKILANPDTVSISDEPSILYATSGLLSNHINDKNADVLMKVINRLPIEFQVICLQGAITRDRTITTSKEIKKWVTANAKDLL